MLCSPYAFVQAQGAALVLGLLLLLSQYRLALIGGKEVPQRKGVVQSAGGNFRSIRIPHQEEGAAILMGHQVNHAV